MIIVTMMAINTMAQTPVSGDVSGVWDVAGSPYLVIDDCTVQLGDSLVIEAGIEVIFYGYYQLIIFGALDAVGSEGEPIVFTSSEPDPAPGDWYRIRIRSNDVVMAYWDVSYAESGIYLHAQAYTGTSLFLEVEIHHSVITQCVNGIQGRSANSGVYSGRNRSNIHHNVIKNCDNGIYWTASSGGGLNQPEAVANNTIYDCDYGIYCDSSVDGPFFNNLITETDIGIKKIAAEPSDVAYNCIDIDSLVFEGFDWSFGTNYITNLNGDSCDFSFNIMMNPQLEDSVDLRLTVNSPCIDAGDPTSSFDPDSTIADIGAFYFEGIEYPQVDIELTYVSGSPVSPAGGSIYFDVFVENADSNPLDFDAWLAISYESGLPNTVVSRSFTNYQPDWTINRPNMWYPIPLTYAAGNYTFFGKVGEHPNIVWDESSFPFEKSGQGDHIGFVPFEVDGAPNPFEGVLDCDAEAPSEYALNGCYPNPFNPATTISFELRDAGSVKLTVFDIAGREVASLVNGYLEAGPQNVTFDAHHLPSGVYFARIDAGEFTAVEKMVLMK